MKILFQGDSITDWLRDYEDFHDMGQGYARYASELLSEYFPQCEFEFINQGISGNQTADLVRRWQTDCIDFQPDVVSILVGVNDTWHRAGERRWLSNEAFEDNYRYLLREIKEKTDAKIIIIEQFLLPVEDKQFFREDIDPKIQIVRKLSREFADAYVPTDGVFAAACVQKPPEHWAPDGVHPSEAGARLIARYYVKAFRVLGLIQ